MTERWPCMYADCSAATGCERVADECGWVGAEDPPVAVGDAEPEAWDGMVDDGFIPPDEPPDEEDEPPVIDWVPESEVLARYAQVHEAARRVHVANMRPERRRGPGGEFLFSRLAGEFDPRARHVGCDGDREGSAGCGAAPGEACSAPGRRFVPGFVHPSRLAAERMLFGLD